MSLVFLCFDTILIEFNGFLHRGMKRNAVLFLANETLRIYFHVRNATCPLESRMSELKDIVVTL